MYNTVELSVALRAFLRIVIQILQKSLDPIDAFDDDNDDDDVWNNYFICWAAAYLEWTTWMIKDWAVLFFLYKQPENSFLRLVTSYH